MEDIDRRSWRRQSPLSSPHRSRRTSIGIPPPPGSAHGGCRSVSRHPSGSIPAMHRRMPPMLDVVGHPLLPPYFSLSLSFPLPLMEVDDRLPDLVSRRLRHPSISPLLSLPCCVPKDATSVGSGRPPLLSPFFFLSLFPPAAHGGCWIRYPATLTDLLIEDAGLSPSLLHTERQKPSPDVVGHPLLPTYFSLSLFPPAAHGGWRSVARSGFLPPSSSFQISSLLSSLLCTEGCISLSLFPLPLMEAGDQSSDPISCCLHHPSISPPSLFPTVHRRMPPLAGSDRPPLLSPSFFSLFPPPFMEDVGSNIPPPLRISLQSPPLLHTEGCHPH